MEISELLTKREETHGNYVYRAEIAQELKKTMSNNCVHFTAPMRESIDMICVKLSRIAAGDPDFRDHWKDIAGYAQLVADLCTK